MSEAVKRSVWAGGRATVTAVGLRPVCTSLAQALRQAFAHRAGRHDSKEGVTAFVLKREPLFGGN